MLFSLPKIMLNRVTAAKQKATTDRLEVIDEYVAPALLFVLCNADQSFGAGRIQLQFLIKCHM